MKTNIKPIQDVIQPVQRPIKILQYGEGNFLRTFIDWMVDIANEKTAFNGNIAIVQPIEKGMCETIHSQNGLYTTILRGIQNGNLVSETRTIASVSSCINPYKDWEAYLALSKEKELRFVISNTTEAGIAWQEGTKKSDTPPQSFPSKLTAFLYARYCYFKADISKGLVFIPCELIDKNGEQLKTYVLQHAREWNLENAFISWIEQACTFCNSLVDRIVPGYPSQEIDAIQKGLGYTDALITTGELFHLWVIESERDFSKEFPLSQAGLNVIWTKDMSFYRTRKVRILNGTHTLFVPAAYLMNLETVEQSLKDADVFAFIQKALFEEIIPSIGAQTNELESYAEEVLERFANPSIRHLLISIMLNSISKFKTRNLPSLISYMDKKKEVPKYLSLSLAALIFFYLTKPEAQDDPAILETFKDIAHSYPEITQESAIEISKKVLSNTKWWDEDLSQRKDFLREVSSALENIAQKGMRESIQKAISN